MESCEIYLDHENTIDENTIFLVGLMTDIFTLAATSRDIFLFSDLIAFGEIKDCTFSVRVQIAKILRY